MPAAGTHLHTFYLDTKPVSGVARLDREESHHAAVVLRKKAGDKVRLVDGRGNRLVGELTAVSDQEVRVKILETSVQDRPKPELWVAQAVPKGKKLGHVLRWAVELEMQGIYFLESVRSVPRISKGKLMERAKKILVSELKVSNCAWMPEVAGTARIDDLLRFSSGFPLKILAWEESTRDLHEAIRDLDPGIDRLIYAIGPEGGFSGDEARSLIDGGYVDVSLGKTRMRTETAQAYLGSILRFSFRGQEG